VIRDPWRATRENLWIHEPWGAIWAAALNGVLVAIRNWFEVYFQDVAGNFE
jgi:hypothetical protein